MKRLIVIAAAGSASLLVLLQACSGDDTAGLNPGADSGTHDATSDGSLSPDSTADTAPSPDSAADTSADTSADSSPEASTCPLSWTVAPVVDPVLNVPDGGGGVLLHGAATGTQNYACLATTVDGGTVYKWLLVAPQANLADCHAVNFATHFADGGNPGAPNPEWLQTSDGTYVVGKKLVAETPDGGASAIPWLLLQGVAYGGSGTLSRALYIQRVNTAGGLAPTATCDVGTVNTTMNVPYTADYYFFGN